MQFSPDATATCTVLAHLPLALAEHLQPGRIDQQVARRIARPALDRHAQRAPATRQRRVIRHRQIGAHQLQDRAQQPLGRPQRQAVQRPQRQHALDRRLRIRARRTAPARALRLLPARQRVLVDPQRQAAALYQRRFVLGPVAYAVGGLRLRAFGFGGCSRHADNATRSDQQPSPGDDGCRGVHAPTPICGEVDKWTSCRLWCNKKNPMVHII